MQLGLGGLELFDQEIVGELVERGEAVAALLGALRQQGQDPVLQLAREITPDLVVGILDGRLQDIDVDAARRGERARQRLGRQDAAIEIGVEPAQMRRRGDDLGDHRVLLAAGGAAPNCWR